MPCKLNCITVNFDRTQHGIYLIHNLPFWVHFWDQYKVVYLKFLIGVFNQALSINTGIKHYRTGWHKSPFKKKLQNTPCQMWLNLSVVVVHTPSLLCSLLLLIFCWFEWREKRSGINMRQKIHCLHTLPFWLITIHLQTCQTFGTDP